MKLSDRDAFYETMYFHEMAERDRLDDRFRTLLSIVSVVFALIVWLFNTVVLEPAGTPLLFWVIYALATISFVAAIVCYIKAWHSQYYNAFPLLSDIELYIPWASGRIEDFWDINEKHGIRLLLATLSYSEEGVINNPINFAGASFSETQAVNGEYTFNSWRVGYRFHWQSSKRWNSWIGATLKVRDAEIKLTQGSVSSLDDDLGIVPLLYLAGEYRFDGPWAISADIDALGGGPGRAIDLGVNLSYAVHDEFRIGAEYRVLEGGADIDQLFNFAWFNSAFLTVRYSP